MSVRNYGNIPLFSTTAVTASNPSTATLVAELILPATGQADNYEVRFAVGASTSAIWALEHANSAGFEMSDLEQQIVTFTPTNVSAEYVFTFRADPGDRFRARVASTFTGTAAAKIQAEALS